MGAPESLSEPQLDAAPVEAGDIIDAKYRVERVLGAGGMGIVVEAQHLQLGQNVAIKLLAVGDARRAEAIARFMREGRAAAALRGDNVVRIYDVGTHTDGSPFIVMELLRGMDLSTLLERMGALPVDDAVEYVYQAAGAIAEAHDAGIIHRDLKPSNLFITERSDGTACIKVLDFGISKSIRPDEGLQGNLTATRSVMGSPYYMSPEQVRDAKKVDTRTDIWSLGVILHELLAAEPVFKADTLPGICAAIAADRPTPLRSVRPDVPAEIEGVVLRCLEKNPASRFQTARELRATLATFRQQRTHSLRASPVGAVLSGGSVSRSASISPNAPTLAAAIAPPSYRHDVSIEPVSTNDQTVLSAGTSAGAITAARPRFSGKRIFAALIALAGVAGAVGIGSQYLSASQPTVPPENAEPPPAPVVTPPVATSFQLSLESTPPGATVYDGERAIGLTPVQFPVVRADTRERPKTFTLRLEGHQPYTVIQGDSPADVRIMATMIAAPEKPAEPAAPVPQAVPRPRPKQPKAAASAPVNGDSDIRMAR
jgi:serine/threonine-protein kinase